MIELLGIVLGTLGTAAYLFVGAVIGGRTQLPGERYDGTDRLVWIAMWPLWVALMGVMALVDRGFELGKRLNPELRVELKAEAARRLTKTLELLERENEIKLPTGELAVVRPAAERRTQPARAPLRSELRAAGELPPSRTCSCPVCRDYRNKYFRR